ncbi:MAG: cytochrome c3 family protein [Candidatus Delongbacteria bacterium]|nr:cytochrome c3 family protein [Candidatus Delongbacteria bacterium]
MDRMRTLTTAPLTVAISLVLICALTATAQSSSDQEQCYLCHLELVTDDSAPAAHFVEDIHFRKNLGCVACHGGDPESDDEETAMSEEAGFTGVPDRQDIPQVCGRCHSSLKYMRAFNPSMRTDQVDEYYTSIHGRKLLDGDASVATCADCHTVHKIRPVTEPMSSTYPTNVPRTCGRCHSDSNRMAPYGIPTDQYESYSSSVHGVALLEKHDLYAPTCNDCHGNHGASPPGIEMLANVCGMCHASESEIFQKGRKGESFQNLEYPGCIACHTHHDIRPPTEQMISFEAGGLCAKCHDADEIVPVQEGRQIRAMLDSLVIIRERGAERIEQAERLGMEVSEAHFLQRDVTQRLFDSRAHMHSFSAEALQPHADAGIAEANRVLEMGDKAIKAYKYRRSGFAVSTLLLTILAIALYLKIRSID